MALTSHPGSQRSAARSHAEAARLASCAIVAIYRPFFLSGIVTVMTAGCLLGALALLGIALRANYLATAWTPYVLAHANSQLYGWVGFFIMGFSLQHHAPTVAKQRIFHRLAWGSLLTMALGIALRFVAEPLAQAADPKWVGLGVVSACLQAVAVVLFVFNTAVTRYRPRTDNGSNIVSLTPQIETKAKFKPLTWQTSFVFLSLACLVIGAFAEPFVFAMSHQADKTASIQFVAEWFSPLREIQFLGFVSSMIFGIGLAKFHECMGAQESVPSLGLAGFVLWAVGLAVRCTGWLAYFRGGMEPNGGRMYYYGGALLCAGAIFVVGSSGVFAQMGGRLRSHKFLRASMAWLVVAGLMMLFEPRVLQTLGLPFSHAYTGAVRHAVTVGFISQMIIGFSSRIVPNILGMDERGLTKLWATFWLLNIGNTARVALEVATDFTPEAFKFMGFTGFIELIGLALWATHILSLLSRQNSRKVSLGLR